MPQRRTEMIMSVSCTLHHMVQTRPCTVRTITVASSYVLEQSSHLDASVTRPLQYANSPLLVGSLSGKLPILVGAPLI